MAHGSHKAFIRDANNLANEGWLTPLHGREGRAGMRFAGSVFEEWLWQVNLRSKRVTYRQNRVTNSVMERGISRAEFDRRLAHPIMRYGEEHTA